MDLYRLHGGIIILGILEEKDWVFLLRLIKDGNCTPFLESEACSEKTPVISQIAKEWPEKYDHPMEDSFYELQIQVYYLDYRKFAAELRTRWEAFNRGI